MEPSSTVINTTSLKEWTGKPETGTGWTCAGFIPGQGLLVHNVDPAADRIRAKIGLLSPNDVKIKSTESIEGFTKIEAKLIGKAVVLSVSDDGNFISLAGVRKRIGGYLAIWGRGLPKKQLVHQEKDNGVLTSAPRILGNDKHVRPKAVKISLSGQIVVLTTHDYKYKIWKTRNTPQGLESWSGIWLSLSDPSPPEVRSLGDITFPSRTSVFITTATVGSASSGSDPFQFWTSCPGTPAIHSPSKNTRKVMKKPCLVLRQRTVTLPDTEKGVAVEGRLLEYATPLPVDEAWTGQPASVIQQAISVKWDSESSVVAISIGSHSGSRILFASPGQSICQTVSLPPEMTLTDNLQWWGGNTLLACMDSTTGRFCIVPRLGSSPIKINFAHREQSALLVRPGNQASVSTVMLDKTKKPFNFKYTAIGRSITTGQMLLVSNGASVLRLSFSFNCQNTGIASITSSLLPQWLGSLSAVLRYLTTQREHSVRNITAICGSVVNCIAEDASTTNQIDSRGIKNNIKEAIRLYTENITSLWWSVGCLGLSCLDIVVVIIHHLTSGIVQLLVIKLIRSASTQETLQSLDGAYHVLKWGEKQFSRMMSFHERYSKPTLEWYFKGYWVTLYKQVNTMTEKVDGSSLQGYHTLKNAILTKLQSHCPTKGVADHPEVLIKGHRSYLSGVTLHGTRFYKEAERIDCAFSLRLLESTVPDIIEHALLAIQNSLQNWDNSVYLVHAPSLRKEKCSETRICDAFATLLTSFLFDEEAYVLPPILCSAISDLVLIGGGDASYEPLSSNIQKEEFCRMLSSFISPVSVHASELELLSSLLCELYCIAGLPLEALHIALLFRRSATLAHILRILAWHTSGQQSLHGWTDTSVRHSTPSLKHQIVFDGYKACRSHIKETMLSSDDTSKLYLETIQDPNNMVRGGWVCAHCMEECLTLFALRSIKEGDVVLAQTLLRSSVATPKFRATVCRFVIDTAKEVLSQIPVFDPRFNSGACTPTSVFLEVLKQQNDNPKGLHLKPNLSSALQGNLPPQSTQPMSRLIMVARLLAWALIFLVPSSEPSRCSRSLLKIIARYKTSYSTPHPDTRSDADKEITDVFSYLFAAQCWHQVHSNSFCSERAVLGVPDSWRQTGEEEQETHTTQVAAKYCSKFIYWSDDIWRQDESQRGCLSCLELCSDNEAVDTALSKAFYEDARIDCPMQISVSTKGQYNRIKNELLDEKKSTLVSRQKTSFDDYYSQPDSIAQGHVAVDEDDDPASKFSFRSHMFELDNDYWEMVSSLITDSIVSSIDSPENEVGTEPYTELAYTTALISKAKDSSSDSSVILPFGTTPVSGVVRALFSKTTSSGEGAGEDQLPTKFTSSDSTKTVSKKTRSEPVKEYAADTTTSKSTAPKSNSSPVQLKKVTAPTASIQQSTKMITKGTAPAVSDPTSMSPRLVPNVDMTTIDYHQLQAAPTQASNQYLPTQFSGLSQGGMLLEVALTPPRSSSPAAVMLSADSPRMNNNITDFLPMPKPIEPPSCSGTSITQGTTYTESGTTITSVTPSFSVSAPTSSSVPLTPVAISKPEKRKQKPQKPSRLAEPVLDSYVGPTTPPRRTHKRERGDNGEHDNRGVKEVHYHYNTKHDHVATRNTHGHGQSHSRTHSKHRKHSRDCRKCGKKKTEKHDKRVRHPPKLDFEPPQRVSDMNLLGNDLRRVNRLDGEQQAASIYDQHRRPALLRGPDFAPPTIPPPLVRPPTLNFPPDEVGLKRPEPEIGRPPTGDHLSGILLNPKVPPPAPPVGLSQPEPLSPDGKKHVIDSPKVASIPSLPGSPTPEGIHVACSPIQSVLGSPKPQTLEKQTSYKNATTVNQPTSPMTPLVEGGKGEGLKTLSSALSVASEGLPPVPPAATPVTQGINSPIQSPASSFMSPQSQAFGTTTGSHIGNLGPSASFKSQAEVILQQQTSVVGQPALSAIEELAYAKYIQELGITSVDAVITSAAAPLVKHVIQPEPVEDINAKHAALMEMEARDKQLATIGREIPVASPPKAAPVAVSQPTDSAAEAEQKEAKANAKLEELLSRMVERQETAAANAGKELATAFTETLKGLSPALASSLEYSGKEVRELEREGVLKYLQAEGTELQRIARSRLARPEDVGVGLTDAKPSSPTALNDEEYNKWVERQRQVISGIEGKPSSVQVDKAPERVNAEMQTFLSAGDLGSGEGYLSVREISAKENSVAEASLSPIQPPPIEGSSAQDALTAELLDGDKSAGRTFLNIQDTHQPQVDIPRISEVRTWQVQSTLNRFGRDIDQVQHRADDTNRTISEATAVIQSSNAVLRDSERLRSNRLINQTIDALRDEAEQVEARLNRPMYQTTYSLPSQTAAPLTERHPATSSPAADIRIVSPSEKRHFLQDYIEEGASGTEPFIWQNDTGVKRHQSPRIPGISEPSRVPAVLLSSDSLPLVRQTESGREEEFRGSPAAASLGSPQVSALSQAAVAAAQFRPPPRDATKEVELSPQKSSGPKRTTLKRPPSSSVPLSTVSVSTAYNTTRPARRKQAAAQPPRQRKNPSVPLVLEKKFNELDNLLRDI